MKGLIIFLIILPILVFLIFRKRKRPDINLPENYRDLLNEHVSFYRQLDDSAKVRFEDRIKDFLSYVRIHGVHTQANDLDKLLVAASAVIPTFGFDWHYHNLRDVLLYPDRFDWNFSLNSDERNVLGMVGTGPMQRMMFNNKNAPVPNARISMISSVTRGNSSLVSTLKATRYAVTPPTRTAS